MRILKHVFFSGLLILNVAVLTGCGSLASYSQPTAAQKRLMSMAAGVVVGGLIGAASTPRDENVETHGLAGAATGGLVTAVISNSLFDDEAEKVSLKAENEKLKTQLHFIQHDYPSLLKEQKVKENPLTLKKEAATIRLYKVDQWVTEGDKKFHQDQMIEVLSREK